MGSVFKICDIEVAPQSRGRSTLWAGPYFYPACNQKIRKYVPIPFSVINGAVDGPILCVVGGVHPTEYANIAGAIRLSKELDPKKLNGVAIIIPVLNIPGFMEREYVNPIDGKNVQGNWPGKTGYEGGTITDLILLRVYTELVSKADYAIDLHGSDTHETMLPQASFFRTGKENIDKVTEGMARATGIKYLNMQSGSRGAGTLTRTVSESGKSAIAFELGTGDRMLPEEVEMSFGILTRVMRYLKMLDGQVQKTEGQMLTTDVPVRVTSDGLFHPHVKLGDIVSRGQVLGEVMNLFGDVVETVRAQSDGTLVYWIHNPKVEPGEEMMIILRPIV